MNAENLAQYFIKNNYDVPRNTRDGNMKLQKLLYFAQLFHLARHNELLFDDKISAFRNGCVVEGVRSSYHHGHESFVKRAMLASFDFNNKEIDTIEMTLETFGHIPAKELSDINHEHYAWKHAYNLSKNEDGFYNKELGFINYQLVKQYDLDSIKEIAATFDHGVDDEDADYEVVNGRCFYYDPSEIEINGAIIDQLERFNGPDKIYSMYIDESQGLVIY